MSELKVCPFCKSQPQQIDPDTWQVFHKNGCYISSRSQYIFKSEFETWNSRPDREQVGEREHPEYRCQSCGNANNPTWYAPNELWNEVMGSPNGIICPKCFQEKAQAKGITTIGKVIRLDDDEPASLLAEQAKSLTP